MHREIRGASAAWFSCPIMSHVQKLRDALKAENDDTGKSHEIHLRTMHKREEGRGPRPPTPALTPFTDETARLVQS